MSRFRPHGLATLVVAALVILTACSGSSSDVGAGATGSDATGTTAGDQPTDATAVPAEFAGHTSAIYSQDANWLCRPGGAVDHCTHDDIDASVIEPDGSTSVEHRTIDPDAPIDCFYIYPTVNKAPGGGNDMDLTNTGVETVTVDLQAARFSSVCKVYAPVYRQMNLSAYASADQARAEAIAYGDVQDAFAYYMANWNHGRPIVFIGHSQGSFHLTKLLTDTFDHDPAMRSRLVSALLMGGAVKVPAGEDVGGTFASIPLCRSTGQTGCVVTYNSYGTDPPPDPTAFFGRDTADGLVGACVNPAALGGGPAMLQPYLPKAKAGPIGGTVSTRLVSLPDAISAECRTADGLTYLGITAATQPGDARDVTTAVTNAPGWGLHTSDVDLGMGNLIELVHAQTTALGL